MTRPDPSSLNLKVGFEIHQQLGTANKLFCGCACGEASAYDFRFIRRLRPTQSELGAFDPAAMFEFGKGRTVEYRAARGTSCLVEADEEPPHDANMRALEAALVFSMALNSKVMDEIHVMRKIVIDGSNTTGFQRTMLVATGGQLDAGSIKVGVQSICLEEDAAKLLGDSEGMRAYGLDRLGIPLVEIALEPIAGDPAEMVKAAVTLGRLLRASKMVARGLGSIRQDVNVSILGGPVVEVKGVQQLEQLASVIEYELQRQHALVIIAQKLAERKVVAGAVGDRIEDVSDIMKASGSKKAGEILKTPGATFSAVRVKGFAGLIGHEPYPGIRIGKELGRLVKSYGLDGIFHSDELPNYGIGSDAVAQIRERLGLGDGDAFVLIGGPPSQTGPATGGVIQRLRAALDGPVAETRAATPDGQTVFLRPRPGAARMYPETDIPPIPVTESLLAPLRSKVPRPWDEEVALISKKYGLNTKLATQIFDSDYMEIFERVISTTAAAPTFVASKLTEDIVSLSRQGFDPSALSDDHILQIFSRLGSGSIAKESVPLIFQRLMKNEAGTVEEAIAATGLSAMGDEELGRILDDVIQQNMAAVKDKGAGALSLLMGRSMAVLRGKADGQKINSMLKEKLEKLVG